MHRASRWLRRIGYGWLGVELGAATAAISIVVAVGPWAAVLLARPEHWQLASAAVLSVSIPFAALVGWSALGLSRELITEARRA